VLTVKMYQSADGEIFCDRCSDLVANKRPGLAFWPVFPGTPCICDACKVTYRAA